MPDQTATDDGADDDAIIMTELAGRRSGAAGRADARAPGAGAAGDPEPGHVGPAATDSATKPSSPAVADPAAPKADEHKPDPDIERRQATLQQQEKRQRLALQAEQRKLEERAAELKQKAEKLAQLEDLVRRSGEDPSAVLELLAAAGIGEDRFELIARDLFAASPEGRKKPELREASQRALRERRQLDDVSSLRKELTDIRDEIKARDERAESERRGAETMAGFLKVAKAGADKAPLFTDFYSRKPEKAEAALARIAATMIEETGEIPDADDVLATFERLRREDLEDSGISVEFLKKKPQKTESKTAGEIQSAKTISNDLGTSTKVRSNDVALTEDEEREQILAELRAKRRAEGLG